MKIYEKAYYTRDGYYASEYSKTYDGIKNKHLVGSDRFPDIVREVIIKDIGCPAEEAEYQTSILSCNVAWLFKNPLDAIVPDAIEVWDRIDGKEDSIWVQRYD